MLRRIQRNKIRQEIMLDIDHSIGIGIGKCSFGPAPGMLV
jgi:hypothetical protein